MSTHYLLSLFDDKITDIVTPDPLTSESLVMGSYVVRVPDNVIVRDPVDVTDLITQKYSSTLAAHGLFSSVQYDDMLDASEVNTSTSTRVCLGAKGVNSVFPGGTLTSTTSAFVWLGPGAGPSQAILTWEIFEYVDSDPFDGPYSRKYKEVSTAVAPVTAEVSFNAGATWQTVTDNNMFTLMGPDQGTSLIVRFTHTSADAKRYWIGSWAVLF